MGAHIEETTFHGQPVLALQSADGARALVSLFGAQVLAWQPARGDEALYLSEEALFDGRSPIRGGIPVCFPQFSDRGRLPRHGFARTEPWALRETRCKERYAMAVFGLCENDQTLALWPHAFEAELTLALEGQRLDVEFEVTNTGHAPFAFTAALHTYLRVREVEHVRVEGLSGLMYQEHGDRHRTTHRDGADALVVDGPLDRLYTGVTRPLLLQEPHRNLSIETEGFPDAAIWNPWEEASAALPDLPAGGFRRFLCIEAAAARQRIELDAGQSWWGRQTLIAL